ncbi:MAG: DUF971 domain-containing protein [Chromatiales bacterium]|nr:MAG: DUF971 domain-containing protein [Chromatiales bacterium]
MAHSGNGDPVPTEIKLNASRSLLTVVFDDGQSYSMTSEYLRVYSPSAEVRGHGGGGTLQVGKEEVTITDILPVGNYAVRLVFSDGHNSGLFTWKVLLELGCHQEAFWQDYLERLAAAGHARKEDG